MWDVAITIRTLSKSSEFGIKEASVERAFTQSAEFHLACWACSLACQKLHSFSPSANCNHMKNEFILVSSLLIGCGSQVPTSEATDVSLTVNTHTSGEAGFVTHSHWIDTGEEVVVFDAQFTPELAEEVAKSIESKTDSSIRYLVVTHPNPDKFNGASVFQERGAQVVTSAATAAAMAAVHAYKKAYFVGAGMFTDQTYPKLPTIDVTFDKVLSLDLNAKASITLQVLQNSGVASTQTVAYAREANALFVGDLVHHKVHAWLEGGIVNGSAEPDLVSWMRSLGELVSLAPQSTRVFGGRGHITTLEDAVTSQQEYLSEVERLANAYVAALPDASVLGGAEAAEHQATLAQQVKDAFPSYELGFLVDYSIYGLLNSKIP